MKRIGIGAALLILCGVLAAALLARGDAPSAPVPAPGAVAPAVRSPVRVPARPRVEVRALEPDEVDVQPSRTPTAEAFDALAVASRRWALRCPLPDGLDVEVDPPARISGGQYHTLVDRLKGQTTLHDRGTGRPAAVVRWEDPTSGACAIERVEGTRTVRGTVVFPEGVEPEPAQVFACEGEPFLVEPGETFEADISEGVACVLSATAGDGELMTYLPLASDQPGDALVLALVPVPEPEPETAITAIEGYGSQTEQFQLWVEAALQDPALSELARQELLALAVQAQGDGDRLLDQLEVQLDP